jgi:hypothetical protein
LSFLLRDKREKKISVPHFPEPIDCSNNVPDDKVDLILSRETADAETQGRMRHVFSSTQRT